MNVTAGKRVNFHCVHQSLDVIWKLNESRLSFTNFPPGLSVSQTFLGSDAGFRHTLTIDATLQHDYTSFVCALRGDDTVQTAPALLRVQGMYNKVVSKLITILYSEIA